MNRLLAFSAGVVMLLAASLAGAAGAQTSADTQSAASALEQLEKQTFALPRGVPADKRVVLTALAVEARLVAGLLPCAAVRDLNLYRLTLDSTKASPAVAPQLAEVGATSLTASRLLLGSPRTKGCGGGVTPSDLPATKTTVLRSDESGMSVRVDLPEVQFVPEVAGGQTWTKLVLPNTDTPSAPGSPGIPVASSLLGVPDGAKLSVAIGATESVTLDGVNVYPAQPDPVDDVTPPPDFSAEPFKSAPFTLDRDVYAQRGLSPAQPADARVLGTSRDITIGTLQVPAVQYDPVAKRLNVLKSVVVNIAFDGGKGFNSLINSPWERPQSRTAAALLNASVVSKFRDPPIVLQPCGEELLVITNASTRTAADTYAAARSAAGFLTRVRETGAGANQIGTTAAQIQTYIRSQLNASHCIHPSYVTIVGDDVLVPTWTATPGSIPSDNPYSMRDDLDELPDVAVGRILGNDLAQVDTAIAKIIGYETSPPGGAWLSHATLAAQFQDDDANGREDRTFVQFAETVRTGLAGMGNLVDRIYEDNPTTNPTQFNDGTALPAALLKPTFPWDGDGADVTAAWNSGRFIIVHRDHGWSDGWGDPFYTTDDVDALSNGALLPVLLSINCASGAYDIDDTSFVQNALVKADGGAVGVFGDTRNSPSWHNTQIAWGFVDALLPPVLPAEGPATKQRVGDALVLGKLRLAGISPPGGDGSTRSELFLWHYFGDPTMQMWGGDVAPVFWNPKYFEAVYKKFPPPDPGDPPPFLVQVTLPVELTGQAFSLLRNGEVIGKGIAGDGTVEVPATFNDGEPKAGELVVAFEADGAVPVQIPVDVPQEPTETPG
jgi:Peptidase family C25/Propeptide_C25